jgi:GNAT superfamily N-acetyltransferase
VNSGAAYARNAASMWWALAEDGDRLLRSERVCVVAPSPFHSLRAIVLDSACAPDLAVREVVETVLPRVQAPRRVVEDASGVLDLTPHGFHERFRFPVMVHPGTGDGTTAATGSGASRQSGAPGGEVTTAMPVTDPERLAVAERILIAVFPPARVVEKMRGLIQPVRVLRIPGWQVWLAHRSGVPAGAAYSYFDGTSVGLYQLATLPEHRGHGVASATMSALFARYPGVPVTLTATDQGLPLYQRLGFRTVSTAIWWIPGPTPAPSGDDMASPLR